VGTTARYKLRYIDVGQPLAGTRAQLEANATTTDAALGKVQDYVTQLAAYLGPAYGAAHKTFLAADTDGVPYFDPAGTAANPVGVGLDADGTPYYFDFEEPTP
jgi:hypothetical protein